MTLTKTLLALVLATGSSLNFCSRRDNRRDQCECQDLPKAIADTGVTLTATTEWDVEPEQIITYPCSTGYLANGAANYNLEEDIQHFVNEELNEQLAAAGFDSKKCGYKCDFNNGALSSGALDPSIFKDSNSVEHQYSNSEKKFLCGPGGALEQLWSSLVVAGKKEALMEGQSACQCKKDVPTPSGGTQNIDTGCVTCAGTVNYGITTCYEKCDLVAEINPLTIGGVSSGVSGTVCVQESGGGIVFRGWLTGLEENTQGGFHIHGGNQCGTASTDTDKQGGHFFEGNYPDCKIENDPWVPEAPYFSNWVSNDLGTAAPVITRPGIVAGGQNLDGITGFTIGDKDNKCGVEGKTVIVHLSSGTRAACGVLEAV